MLPHWHLTCSRSALCNMFKCAVLYMSSHSLSFPYVWPWQISSRRLDKFPSAGTKSSLLWSDLTSPHIKQTWTSSPWSDVNSELIRSENRFTSSASFVLTIETLTGSTLIKCMILILKSYHNGVKQQMRKSHFIFSFKHFQTSRRHLTLFEPPKRKDAFLYACVIKGLFKSLLLWRAATITWVVSY